MRAAPREAEWVRDKGVLCGAESLGRRYTSLEVVEHGSGDGERAS